LAGSPSEIRLLLFGLGVFVAVFFTLGRSFAQEPSSPPSPPADSSESLPEPSATTTQKKQPATNPPSPTKLTKEEAWQILRAACTEEKTPDRAAAIRALGLIPNNARARKLAEGALMDDKADIRLAAADALGAMKARASIPKLKRALNDSDPTVVLAAAHSLELMHSRSAYQVYYEVLAGDRKTHRGLIASQTSALKDPKKIAQLGLRQGMGFVPFGGVGWTAMKMLAKDDSSPVRAAAAAALTNDPDPAAARALTDALGDKSWMVRTAALEALAKRGDPAVIDTVQLYAYDEQNAVRYTAAAAVVHLTAIREAGSRKRTRNASESAKTGQ
jgi:HEAT repeat protein